MSFFKIKRIKKDILYLRVLILIGLASIVIFFAWLLKEEHFGGTVLYYLLVFVMIFSAIKVLGEWYHYFVIKFPEEPKNDKIFTVDIFTTFCAGEPIEMVENTLLAIKKIKYPHKTYLCDEDNNERLKDFCEKHGINHVTRLIKKDAKAGNINNALQYSDGELCVVLDPDHVPQPDFLDPIIPYFANPKIGFVQIVQAYKNIRESIISRGAAQQTFQFYGPMMMGMNSYGTVLAIGANCTFRRKALDSIGGHASGLAEDMNTAMKLHAKGWESVYVPKILARGLVPSTLDAYYKQQLKWSRGVFELLFTTYPLQFNKFTWQQKVHYGFLPIHYFSGIVYLINFLIPIIALFISVIPLRVDLVEFLVFSLPFFFHTLLIRHYVQKWVMEENERGFHMLGGFLQIGTWWVHSLGFIYSIIRKKVPYIPTPKDGEEGNNLLLNLPNLIIIALSLAAIIYGILKDYSPYTFVMAGLAATNCLFMFFMLMAGRPKLLSKFYGKLRTKMFKKDLLFIMRFFIWKVKHDFYAVIRRLALPFSITLIIAIFIIFRQLNTFTSFPKVEKKGFFYSGIFSPVTNNGLTQKSTVIQEEFEFNLNFDIVSSYIPWGDKVQNFPDELLHSYIEMGKYPLITWEPWVSTFSFSKESIDLSNEKNGLSHILNGEFDDYIDSFALQIKSLNHPVFLRFAHEHDNPFYPWSFSGGNTPNDFVNCWRYVHDKFEEQEVFNVIWVWNPWRSDHLSEYFPGGQYVDWIGITGLNYGNYSANGDSYDFDELYRPFKEDSIFQRDLPVLIAEFGSVATNPDQKSWFESAFRSISINNPEIKGIVFYNSSIDENLPVPMDSIKKINWKVGMPKLAGEEYKKLLELKEGNFKSRSYVTLANDKPEKTTFKNQQLNDSIFQGLKGVNYRKGNSWFRNYYSLNYRTIVDDFNKLKGLGINTIKWPGPGIYDRNVLSAAKDFEFDIHYSFWIPNETDFVNDKIGLQKLTSEILSTVRKYKNNHQIKSWNIGNDPWESLNKTFIKPDVFWQRNAYLNWLNNIIMEITEIDDRPISIDIEVTKEFSYKARMINSLVPQISAFGLIYKEPVKIPINDEAFSIPLFYSDIPPKIYLENPTNKPAFLSSYQDLGTHNFISFTGLVDHEGNEKREYCLIKNKWDSINQVCGENEYRILKQANAVEPNKTIHFFALERSGFNWERVKENSQLKLKWFLIKTDGYQSGKQMQYLGEGTNISFTAPQDYKNYLLQLSVENDGYIIQTSSKLFTPLVNANSSFQEIMP